IQCGTMPDTTAPWRHIASLGGGKYFTVGQAGSVVAVATPFAAELARLSTELDATRMFYGTEAQRRALEGKTEAAARLAEEASTSAQAKRAAFNAGARAGGPGRAAAAANFAPAQEL